MVQAETPYFTTGKTARTLDVAESTVRKWDSQGRLSSIRASSGARLFRAEDVLRLAAQRQDDGQ